MGLIDVVKRNTPWALRRLSRKVKLWRRQRRDAQTGCKEVFTRIYETNAWGGRPGELYSGPGSREEAARPYTDAVCAFIRERGIRSVVDLGCGDFRVGRVIAATGVDYTGVDIVDLVVEQNTRLHGSERVRFRVANIVEDDLPAGELCLVREVLQHLSNAEILRALPKLARFRYVIVTDYQPGPSVQMIPNIDKPHGAATRLYRASGVVLDRPPFNLANVEPFVEVVSPDPELATDERLCSFLIRNDNVALAAE